MISPGQIQSMAAFSMAGRGELKLWIESWLPRKTTIDSTENVGFRWGVNSRDRAGDAETEGYALTADGVGGSLWGPAGVQAFPSQVLAHVGSDLVAYWRMGEVSGDELDYSEYAVGGKTPKDLARTAGTTVGTYDVTGGLPASLDDGAFRFNYNQAVNDGASLGDYFSATDTGTPRWGFAAVLPFTVECLFKPTSGWLLPATGFGGAAIVGTSTRVSASHIGGWALYRGQTNGILFTRSNGLLSSTTDVLSSPSAVTLDIWHHLAATYDGTTMRLYIDGLLVNSVASSVSQSNHAAILVGMGIQDGAGTTWNRYAYGTVDEVAVYSAALTPAEIAMHAAAASLPEGPTTGDISVYLEGTAQLATQGLNFKAGAKATVATAANATLDAVDVTINALVTDANIAVTDVTTNNATTGMHGFLKKLSGTNTEFLDGSGAFDTVKDSDLALTDITTNNAAAGQHGFLKKLSSVAAEVMNGAGNWVGIGTIAVASIKKFGSSALVGDVVLKEGSNVSISQSGNDITIAATGGGGGSAFVATDLIWDAKGDIAVATAADTAIKVAVGSNGDSVMADSTATAGVAYDSPTVFHDYLNLR